MAKAQQESLGGVKAENAPERATLIKTPKTIITPTKPEDEEDAPDEPDLRKGAQVIHQQYGKGVVVKIDNNRISVKFGSKNIDFSYSTVMKLNLFKVVK